MTDWIWDLVLLAGGFSSGAFLALLVQSLLAARAERRALRALVDELAVVRPTGEPHPGDRRAREIIELWSEQAAMVPWLDRRIWDCNKRLVIEVAHVYGKQLADVRISQAAQIISRLLSDDLGKTLGVLERYMTVHRVMQMTQYWEKYQELSQKYPTLGPGLQLANSMRKWGMRAFRLVSRRIPQLLFFEAAGTAAMYGAREYFGSLVAELTGKVGLAAIELYSGSQVTIAEQATVRAGMEILLLEQLAQSGEAPGELERRVIEQHAEKRGLPGDKLGPIVAELSRADSLTSPDELALRIELDEVIEEAMLRLIEMCPAESSARATREAFVESLRESLAECVQLDSPAEQPADEPVAPSGDAELLQLLWSDVLGEGALPDHPPEGEALDRLLENQALFVRGIDLWRLAATREEVVALLPKLRKALWLAGAGRQCSELIPSEVVARLAGLFEATADAGAIVSSFRQRFEKSRASWLSFLSPGRLERDRLLRFVEDQELVSGLTASCAVQPAP